ncbi:signaling threshold-regulating transmembrane adapter 1 isoform X2 [Poecilia reticulata]|uniref:signaling threshold-regulating transmembrane adapter 1 isoform X2 n=1 Tax=Poecilia reticulata TaxID=8081 RepID=UPI0004A3F39A|nr:PREDICTED: signaling threshold-regulating transmembrane adapter 1 isoform X2 [Poecilia reticulata]
MGNCDNRTQVEEHDWLKLNAHVIVYVLGTALALSLLFNMACCLSKICSGKGRCQCRKRRSRSSRQMEDNPIYGNLSYMDSSVAVYTDPAPLHSSLSSSSLRIAHRIHPDSQSKSQECYANLTLKAPRPQSGRISPQILVSDIVHLEEAEETGEAETEEPVTIDDAVSTMSDLYASVQTQRAKMVDTADGEEGYANHL